MLAIAQEAKDDPELVKNAPHSTPVRRLDEARAARKPVLRWEPRSADGEVVNLFHHGFCAHRLKR